MIFNFRYMGQTTVNSSSRAVGMNFVPDALRDPTFFIGKLGKHIPFREAISALHDVVVSDLRYRPKDREAYKAWVAEQEPIWVAEALAQEKSTQLRIQTKREKLQQIQSQKHKALKPFYSAQRKYFNYLAKKDMDMWYVLDPVITVHPDELFFECFSQDESSYGRLGCNYNVFKEINEFECGTTNIDYSKDLYNEFQKIREYKETDFKIDPGGFQVATGQEDTYEEVKIDLPDSWVRGFLQVSSAMSMNALVFDLHPMDIHNFLFVLKRQKERKGPRSIRFRLNPGQPIKAIFEPWNIEVICPRSPYTGDKKTEVRIWGRRRLLILERLIPITRKFTVVLLGTGLPSFYIADLGDMNFTLGLSGWTTNDWSRMGQFDLLAPRKQVDSMTQQRVFSALKKNWSNTPEGLSKETGLDTATVLGALGTFVQAGKAIYDLPNQMYRVRELSREPLPLESLRFTNEREEKAQQIVLQKRVQNLKTEACGEGIRIRGTVVEEGKSYSPVIILDRDQRMIKPNCSCKFIRNHKLTKGPCEHMLAIRIAAEKQRSLY